MMMARFEDAPMCAVLLLLVCVSTTFAVNRQLHECSQNLVADRPVLISSNNASSKQCTYTISVPPNTLPDHAFHVSLLTFSVGQRSSNGSSCTGGWAQIGGSTYCGASVSPGTVLLFPTSSHHQLEIVVEPGPELQFQARVELLPRLTLQERHPEMILATPGEPMPLTECDRVYSCLQYPGYCQLTSPGFPGAYSRPLNCSYHLKAPEAGVIIGGRHELYEVGENHRITHNCSDSEDHIAIYDGEELVSRFCGKSRKFPRIVSKTSDIVLRFVSTQAGLPARGFVISAELAPPHLTEHARCFETVKVGSGVHQLRSPHHWLARGAHCSYTLAAKPGKQIWLLMTHIKTRSNCSEYDEHVTVYDGNERIANLCNQSETHIPLVSSGNQLKVVYYSPNGTLDATSRFYFIARFAAVNAIESGQHLSNTWCDTVFATKTSGPFNLLSPRDVILYTGKENLTCKYYFRAPESYTVRLQLDHTSFEPLHRCPSVVDSCETANFDKIAVTEQFEKNVLGCECGARKHAQIFQSKGSEMIVTLTLNLNHDLVNTSLKHSPELYQFQGRYMFIPPSDDSLHCGVYTITNHSLQFPSRPNLYVTTPIMCRWQLRNITLIQLNHLSLSTDCKNNHIIFDTDSGDFNVCNGDRLPEEMQGESVINVYLVANRGHPQLNLSWNVVSWSSEDSRDDETCYSTLTLSLMMVAAAVCTMTIVLALALVVYRYRASLWYSSWRRQRYSSVTIRNTNNPSFW